MPDIRTASFTLVDPQHLPTHLARVVARANRAAPDDSANTFLYTSYVVESLIKTLCIALCAGMRRASATVLYQFEHDLVRADGLGKWEAMIGACVTQSYAGYIDAELRALLEWLSKKRLQSSDGWAHEVAHDCEFILGELGAAEAEVPRKLDARYLLSQFVRIRNKTKAHGAVGEEFFGKANSRYLSATRRLLESCPIREWEWFFLATRGNEGTVKAIRLRGTSPPHVLSSEAETLRPVTAGIHFRLHEKGHLFHCGDLLRTGWECRTFRMPNGAFTDSGYCEYLDYADGSNERVDVSRLLAPPAPLPPSATEGQGTLEIYSNVFGNLPGPPKGYVERPKLQAELLERLNDKNHTIITLHGRGGMGKTSLALFAAHWLSQQPPPSFEYIIWLSARDLELRPSGHTEVRRAVSNLDEVCKLLGKCVGIAPSVEAFAQLLQDPKCIGSKGMLFIFDNFETFDDPRGLHIFLDRHTHIPNKVLLTSRERAFKGDFPIEVGGMELEEARELLSKEAAALGIERVVTSDVIEEIFEGTDGHAYVMRVLLGEIAKDNQWVPLKSLVPRRSDVLNAVFERSFNKLTPDARWLFLTVANWRSAIGELALLVILGQHGCDVESAIDECMSFALIARNELADSHFCYAAPELARLFAKKKLEGDPDRLLIREDLERLQQFGPIKAGDISGTGTDKLVSTFVHNAISTINTADDAGKARLDVTLARLAEMWPSAWADLAQFRQHCGRPNEEIAYALRRAVEEKPYDKDAWLARAKHAERMGDNATRIASFVSAVEADPKDVTLIREVAIELCKYVDAHKFEIPQTRRGVYLASVRSHMARVADDLDSTGLSRLAWLFLLEGDKDSAWKYANRGLEKDSTDSHCLNIVQKLDSQR